MASIEIYRPDGILMLSSLFPTYAFTGSTNPPALHTTGSTAENLFNENKLVAGVVRSDGSVKEYTFSDVTKLQPSANAGLVFYRETDGKPVFMLDRRPLVIIDSVSVNQNNFQTYSCNIPQGSEYSVILLSSTVDMTASNQWMPPSPPNWEEYYMVTEINEYLHPKFNAGSITVQNMSSSNRYDSDYPVQSARATKYLDMLIVDTTDLP